MLLGRRVVGWLELERKRQTDLVTMKDPYRQLWSFPLRTCFCVFGPTTDDVASRPLARHKRITR